MQTSRSQRAPGDPKAGAMIRAARVKLGLSQEALGHDVDRSRSHVANIEAGRDGAGAKMLAKMAKRLGLSLDALMESPAQGTPGTYTLTLTETEADLVLGSRGHPEEDIKSLAKTLLRGSLTKKQS